MRAGFVSRVYPRVCGGISIDTLGSSNQMGLCPRVRGNDHVRCRRRSSRGSIPACAGESVAPTPTTVSPTVYPRVCGGISTFRARLFNDEGLSPRVRGNQGHRCLFVTGEGSIPACAGESIRRTRRAHSGSVYPRVCGGIHPKTSTPLPEMGLSPRVRGNPASCSNRVK